MSAAQFYQSLTYLVPTGFAWPRDPNTTLMRTLHGVAAGFSELHDWTLSTAADWLPHMTRNRLAEWEQAAGLPDDCFGPLQSPSDRQARLLARLRGWSGAYADSSPASLGAIEAFLANMGYPGVARYNTPFRAGRDRTGRRLGVLDGRLHVLVPVQGVPMRVGVGRVGDRLKKRPIELAEMVCALQRRIPARFDLNVILN